ncbi:flagellar brake protein [candidate division KSB1 bacterium]
MSEAQQMDEETFLTILSRDTGVNLELVREIFNKVGSYLDKTHGAEDSEDEHAWERIKPGQKILLEVLDGQFKGKYMSQIVHRGHHTVFAAIPRNESGLVKIPPDTQAVVRFQNEDTIVGFKAAIGGFLSTDPPSFNLNIQGPLITKSLRKFPRTKTRIACDAHYHPQGKGESSDLKKSKGLIKDISAGGVRLAVGEEDIGRGQILYLSFELPDTGLFDKIKSEVVYISERSKEQMECGIKFVEIEAAQRDMLAGFVSQQLLS